MSACAAGYADHVDADVALAFVDGTLAPSERAEVERRIDGCHECRAAIASAARDTAPATKRERPISARQAPVQRSVQLVAGEVVGRYIVERPIGAGGMGVVSLARDPELRRAVVIKLVRPDASDDDLEARLRREAQAMAQLSHPNVVQIFDIGRHGDRVFLAMEFIPGETLDAWLIERERTTNEILAMFLQAGAGLAAAHRAGLLHRDFKPSNVLVDRNGTAKVTDFGLARALAPSTPSATQPMPQMSGVHAVLTQRDTVIGTPAYMAPEQSAGQPLDGRTDQYALALALLDALVGQPPTRREIKPTQPPAEIVAALDKVPPRARAAIALALSFDPDARWPDLATFLGELAPERKERRWWPFVAAGALAIAAVTTFFAVRRETPVVSCVAEAPRTWAKSRAGIESKLAAQPRELATWHAAHVLDAIDKAVADIGTTEVARCQGTTVDAPCLAQRQKALAAIDALSPANPWAHVRAIAACAPVPSDTESATLGAELPTASPARARAIAERARILDDDLLRADALDRAGTVAISIGDFEAALADLEAEATTGERTGDDSVRGRAVLGLLELARVRGDLAEARDQANRLEGLLAKHGHAPRDVYRVALATADTFIELGDVQAAFAAIDRAEQAAKTTDERNRARATHAWAVHLLRWDSVAAEQEIDRVRTNHYAWTIAAELAFARKDAAAAVEAMAEVMKTSTAVVDRLRAARARGLAGDVDAALQDVAAIIGDPTTDARKLIARAHILHDAGRHADVIETLRQFDVADYFGVSAAEIAEGVLVECDANIALPVLDYYCVKPKLVETGHPRSPLHARWLVKRIHSPRTKRSRTEDWYEDAVNFLTEANARPLAIAQLRLELARDKEAYVRLRKIYALEARRVFEAAGRAPEVAELAAILAEIDSGPTPVTIPVDAGPPPPPPPPREAGADPWGP
ncbi:MAG: protein kinase [Myxococcota bacterium]|nr:protein kinase [Myxococcota bacterium]